MLSCRETSHEEAHFYTNKLKASGKEKGPALGNTKNLGDPGAGSRPNECSYYRAWGTAKERPMEALGVPCFLITEERRDKYLQDGYSPLTFKTDAERHNHEQAWKA